MTGLPIEFGNAMFSAAKFALLIGRDKFADMCRGERVYVCDFSFLTLANTIGVEVQHSI